MNVTYEPVTVEAIHELADNMREDDKRECFAVGFASCTDAIVESVNCSSESWCARFNGKVAAIFGVVPITLHAVAPWLLTTTVVDRHRKTFVAEALDIFGALKTRHHLFTQIVHKDYAKAVRLVQRLGFETKTEVKSETGAVFVAVTAKGDA